MLNTYQMSTQYFVFELLIGTFNNNKDIDCEIAENPCQSS